MAIMQYNSGVVEDIKPNQMVFTDQELLEYFKGSERLRSARMGEIPNTWCLWGESDLMSDNHFNQLGSRIVEEKIYSPLLLVHDSELNPDLYLTDAKILTNYSQFRDEVIGYLDEIAIEIMNEYDRQQSNEGTFGGGEIAPTLDILGPTEDRRALMAFDPTRQKEEFWAMENFSIFASKSFGYIHKFFNKNLEVSRNSFAIYADGKNIIIIPDQHVHDVMQRILDNFEKREKYHGCGHILLIMKKWDEYVKNGKEPMTKPWEDYREEEAPKPAKRKRGRPPKKKPEENE